MSRIIGSLIISGLILRNAFSHHKPLSYLLLLGVFLFFCFIIDILRSVFSRWK